MHARTFTPAVIFLGACAAPPSTAPDGYLRHPTPMENPTVQVTATAPTGTAADATSASTGGDAIDPGDCGKENETVETFPGHPNFKKCCPGLGPVFTMGLLGADGKCIPQPPVASTPAVCTKHCGDGKCDGDENKCNCADCK
jgi:hypothetical protein